MTLPYPPLPEDPSHRPPRWLLVHLVAAGLAVCSAATFGWMAIAPLDLQLYGLAFLIGPGGYFVLWALRQKSLLDDAWEAFELARERDDDAAAMVALRSCAQHRRVPISHALSLFELGCCHGRQGNAREAMRYFGAFERHPGRDRSTCASAGALHLALCFAVVGQISHARQWLAEGLRPERRPDHIAPQLAETVEKMIASHGGGPAVSPNEAWRN